MVVIVGIIVILGCALLPWAYHASDAPHSVASGLPLLKAFWMPTEYITIIGLGIGAMVIMAPFQVIKKVIGNALATLKGIPYSKNCLLYTSDAADE